MTEPIVPEPPRRPRLGLWVAIGITLLAVPLLLLDRAGDDDAGGRKIPPVTVIMRAAVPDGSDTRSVIGAHSRVGASCGPVSSVPVAMDA